MNGNSIITTESTATKTINPQGYNYGGEPTNKNPFWDVDYEHNLTASATVDDTSGTPSANVASTTDGTVTNLAFTFTGLKGEQGEQGEQGEPGENGMDGVTPVISATATVDGTTGTPSVSVTKTGTDAAPTFVFNFTGLKGANGQDATLPTGGTAGQVLTKYGTGAEQYSWQTLETKQSTLIQAGTTTANFTVTNANNYVDVYASIPGFEYNSISLSGTTLTITFDAQTTDFYIGIREWSV